MDIYHLNMMFAFLLPSLSLLCLSLKANLSQTAFLCFLIGKKTFFGGSFLKDPLLNLDICELEQQEPHSKTSNLKSGLQTPLLSPVLLFFSSKLDEIWKNTEICVP